MTADSDNQTVEGASFNWVRVRGWRVLAGRFQKPSLAEHSVSPALALRLSASAAAPSYCRAIVVMQPAESGDRRDRADE
jgi:hypothetical protein